MQSTQKGHQKLQTPQREQESHGEDHPQAVLAKMPSASFLPLFDVLLIVLLGELFDFDCL